MPSGTRQTSFLVRRASPGAATTVPITVVDAQPPHLFSFRWTHGAGEVATPTNSTLVTFELSPSGAGTVLRLTDFDELVI